MVIDELFGTVIYSYNLQQVKDILKGYTPANLQQKEKMLREWASQRRVLLFGEDIRELRNANVKLPA